MTLIFRLNILIFNLLKILNMFNLSVSSYRLSYKLNQNVNISKNNSKSKYYSKSNFTMIYYYTIYTSISQGEW